LRISFSAEKNIKEGSGSHLPQEDLEKPPLIAGFKQGVVAALRDSAALLIGSVPDGFVQEDRNLLDQNPALAQDMDLGLIRKWRDGDRELAGQRRPANRFSRDPGAGEPAQAEPGVRLTACLDIRVGCD
jgi:hypothetical protein